MSSGSSRRKRTGWSCARRATASRSSTATCSGNSSPKWRTMPISTDTKMQLRCTQQEKDLWLAVAGGEGNLSEWVREQLNAAATPKTEKTPHIPNLADGDVVRD